MARVFVGVGHGGSDPGAVGYLVEKDVNLIMAKACSEYLKAHGVEVKLSRSGDTSEMLASKIERCNAFSPELALDIHNNAGGGDGFEVYHSVVGGTGRILAKNIESEILKIGQNSRGIKTKKNSKGNDYFGFIRSTKCPAVICEGVFVDNERDAAQADTNEKCRQFGEAYAKGILQTLGISYVENAAKNSATASAERDKTEGYFVKVTADALNIRKQAGVGNAVVGVIRDKGVYTIVEEKWISGQKWGKLKSGAGWICLYYTKKV